MAIQITGMMFNYQNNDRIIIKYFEKLLESYMKRINTQYFIRAVVLVLFSNVFLTCARSQTVTAQVSTPTNQLRIGLWKLSGIDEAQTIWTADLVVQIIRNNTYIGYFDWYSGTDKFYRGREYFEGTYLEASRRVNFRGTRLEQLNEYQGRRIILGIYQASLSGDGIKLYDGFWGDYGVLEKGVPGKWQAEWVQAQSFIDWSNPLAQISGNFTVHDATYLPSWGIYHIPTADEKENIIDLAVALQKVRDAYGRSMNIGVWIRPASVNPGILDSSGKIVSSPSHPKKGQNYNAAIGSNATSHIAGRAVDIEDANRSLTNFLLKNQQILIDNNLWMEDEKIATTYVHLDVNNRRTTGREKGRERIFIP